MSKEYKWKSPIEVDYADFDITNGLLDDVSRKITDGVDEIIIKGCVKVGVNVDKHELVRALDYDREQYKKGFDDGYENGKRDSVVRCGECIYHEDEEPGMVYCPQMVGGWVNDDWFCADGVKK